MQTQYQQQVHINVTEMIDDRALERTNLSEAAALCSFVLLYGLPWGAEPPSAGLGASTFRSSRLRSALIPTFPREEGRLVA